MTTYRRLLTLAGLMSLLWLPTLTRAADCAEVAVFRNNSGYTVQRVLLADGKTATGASTKCVPPSLTEFGRGVATPWDFYRFFGEAGNTCTSWTAQVRDYPLNTTPPTPAGSTNACRGTCDNHIVQTLDSASVTSKTFREPLGEAEDVNVTAITCSGGLSVFVDFYYRNEAR